MEPEGVIRIRRRSLAIILFGGPFIMWRVGKQSEQQTMKTKVQREFATQLFVPSMLRQRGTNEVFAVEETDEAAALTPTTTKYVANKHERHQSKLPLFSPQKQMTPNKPVAFASHPFPSMNTARTDSRDTPPAESIVPSGCNCRNETNIWCCQRTAIVVNGIGVAAKLPKFGENINVQQITADHPYEEQFQFKFKKSASDYRQVLVSYNWYEVITVGYLYHKAGYECWLDPQTNDYSNGWLLDNTKEDWEKRIVHGNPYWAKNHPWPTGNGRSLCRYLAEESLENGLRVYSDWTVNIFVRPLLEFVSMRRVSEASDGHSRTMFDCIEQDDASVTSNIQSFFYSQSQNEVATTILMSSNKTFLQPHGRKKTLWQLHDIVRVLDRTVLDGNIALANSELGCQGD